MDDTVSLDLNIPHSILHPLLLSSGASNLKQALETLIETAKTPEGRLNLASKHILVPILHLCQSFSSPFRHDLLLLSLKLLRNLCAGEIKYQDSFIEENGAEILSSIAGSLDIDSDNGIIRMLLQVLGNVSLAGEKHKLEVWRQFFPFKFLEISRIRSKETCDPLCMVIYTCSGGSDELFAEMCSNPGMEIVTEIIRTVTVDDFKEDWFILILSKICLQESCFSSIFSKLSSSEILEENPSKVIPFKPEQAFFLSILSEILNEQVGDVVLSKDFSLHILNILKNAFKTVEFTETGKSSLPTGSTNIDVLGYSLTILRDICSFDGPKFSNQAESLLSSGLIELLLPILRDLEPPATIRKSMARGEGKDVTSHPYKYCPYRGFRRDIVAIIGNCCYRKKHVQDKIREQDGILVLLQQCVTDELNPFLREWGIWATRNVLEGNQENQELVTNLELQGTLDVPELTQMGLRVEVDEKKRRAKLVNLS